MDIAQFRTMFPEFADTTAYSDPMLTIWLGIAQKLVNAAAWGDMVDYGQALVLAHFTANRAQSVKQSTRVGSTPGAIEGVATAKSVDKVSKSMDAGSVTLADGAFWNTTRYGVEFMTMVRMFGAGGIQL